MLAMQPTFAVNQRTRFDLLNPKGMNGYCGTNDIDNRIKRPDFMKMNFLNALAMNFCLSLCNAEKNGCRMILDLRLQRGLFNQLLDRGVAAGLLAMLVFMRVLFLMIMMVVLVTVHMAVIAPTGMLLGVVMMVLVRIVAGIAVAGMPLFMVMIMVALTGMFFLVLVVMLVLLVPGFTVVAMGTTLVDFETDGGNGLAVFPCDVEMKLLGEVQFLEFPFQCGRFEAEIDHRSQKHVTADSRQAMEIESFHGYWITTLSTD